MRDIKHNGHPSERSIRNISVTTHRRPARPVAPLERTDNNAPTEVDDSYRPPHRKRPRLGRFWLIVIGVAAVAGVGGTLISTVFAGASVTVQPRTEQVVMPETLQAQANAPVGVLSYQTISVTRSASQNVPAQGVQKVSRAASGVITVSNTYSVSSQRLIANTRFEAPDGKIYRIRDSVTVPGMKGGSAGTITATVYADSPGINYNKGGGVVFTIPGFKGDPRYSTFSAKSEGAIAGGFVGDEPAVAPADLATAKTALQKQLDSDTRAAAAQEIPEGFLLVPGSLEIRFADIVQSTGANQTAQITESATATGIMVRQADLASAVAHKKVEEYVGEAVLFGGQEDMALMLATSTKRSEGGPVTIHLSGSAVLIWQFDPNALINALVDKNKSEFQQVIDAFRPAIAKADASIRPFWQGKFPDTADKIRINTVSK